MSDSGSGGAAKTPLFDLHEAIGGKIVDFAGYLLPIQYKTGIKGEHLHCRAAAGLFDVSHMGQCILRGSDADKVVESLMPIDLSTLGSGQQRYSFLLNDQGGILDDLMVCRSDEGLRIVVNAACKTADFALLESALSGDASLEILDDAALLALQGPKAAEVLGRFDPAATSMKFMSAGVLQLQGQEAWASRSGYTGEDGYEISLPASAASAFAEALLAAEEVEAIGLGARDSLRLEAGLCLYGHDIDSKTTPIEAALTWAVGKRRRSEGGFPGAEVIARQLAEGVSRKRVGLRPEGRMPVREGAGLKNAEGEEVGHVTSGGFGPSVEAPVAMGYVSRDLSAVGNQVVADVRGKSIACEVVKMPIVPHSFYRD